MRNTSSWNVAERLLLTLWVGSLWALGYVAVPVLFNELPDRALAGSLAGVMFTALAMIGLLCGIALLAGHALRGSLLSWRAGVLAVMLLLVAAGQFGLAPQIAELRASGLPEGSEAARSFGRLHGIASSLYLLTSLLGLALVAAGPSSDKSAVLDTSI